MTPLRQLPQLRFELPLDAARLMRARERVRDYLRTLCSDEELVDDVVLCVEEACTNAIRHSRSTAHIHVSLAFDDGSLLVDVRDRGKGFDVSSFDPNAAPDPLALGGRGLFLMASMMDELTLHVDDGLRVHMARHHVDNSCAYPVFDTAIEHGDAPGSRTMRVRALLEEIDEAFFAIDWEYRCVHANEAAGRLARHAPGELLGLTPLQVWPELKDTEVDRHLRDAMELGRPSVLEWRTRRERWLEMRMYPTPTGVSVYVRDIDERKKAELAGQRLLDELRRNEERFRATFEQAAVGMAQIGLDGRYERVNDRFCEMLGYTRQELERLSFREVTHRDDVALQQRAIEALTTGLSDTITIDKRYVCRDGGLLWASLTMSLVHDVAGAPDYIHGVALDVSEQRRAAQATRRYELLSEHARDIMLFIRESDGTILEANRAAESAYGYTREQLLALTVFDLRAEGRSPEVQGQMLAASRKGLLFQTEHRRSDGSVFPVEVSSRGAISLDGEIVLLSVVRDVSERVELAKALAEERDVLATVMANTSAQVAYLDDECRFVLVNDAFARGSGVPAAELIGRVVTETVDRPVQELFEQVRASGRAVERSGMPLEFSAQPERGVTYWDWRLAPVVGDDRVRGFVLSRVDVTERVRREMYTEGLSEVLQRLGDSRDPDQLARILAQGVCRVLDADLWGIFEYDGVDTWSPVQFDEQLSPFRGRSITAGESPYGMEAYRTGRVVAVEDCGTSPLGRSVVSKESHIKSVIAAPLELESGPFTALFFSWTRQRRRFSEAEIDFVARAAATTSAAINDARVYRELEERERFAAALNDVSAAITSLLDYQQILSRVVRLAAEALGAESSAVSMREEDAWVSRYVYGLSEDVIGLRLPLDRVPFGPDETQAITVDDVESDPRVDWELQAAWGVRAVAAVPLVVRDKLVGAIFLNYHSGPHVFTPLEVQFISSVSGIISAALETARLYESERHVATTLQSAFVHALPDIAGISFAVTQQLAVEPELVGGDFYDAFELEGGGAAVLVGDVEGKGVRAAGLTQMVRSAVRALALVDPSPAFILRKVNELLQREQPGQFVTAALLVVDPRSGEAVCSSAGHPPAILLSEGAGAELVSAPGVPLGTFPWSFQDLRLRLTADETVLLYTDGLTEVRRDGRLFGVERVVEAACRLAHGSLDELVEGVRDAAVEFGGEVRDDMLVLAFRVSAVGAA